MALRHSLRRRYSHARTAAWKTATVRTSANDRAADAAFRKARKESKALADAWTRAMHVATTKLMDVPEAERKQSLEYAEKLYKQHLEQEAIMEAARNYARLPKAAP